jgi:anaerobic magnesium-protoporphyrin IX monomethyl ester cyclase
MGKTIILFNPNVSRNGGHAGVPLGLLAVSRELEKTNYRIKIYSSWVDKDYEEKIIHDCQDGICFGVTSMTGYQISEGLDISKKVKEIYPDLPIIWGGYHPTILPEETVANKNVDIVVRGQGELAFKELVEIISAGLDYGNVRGITYKRDNAIITNPDRDFEDTNNLKEIPYDLLDIEKYIHISELGSRTLEYVSSQGCPFNCRFCVEPVVYKNRYHALKPERVLDEIEKLVKRHGIDSVLFQDTNFFLNEQRVTEICKGLIERKIKINWGDANGRAPQMTKFNRNTWDLIKESGCKSILIGAESALQPVLDYLDKRAKVEDTIELAEICSNYDISIKFSLMIGLPPDRELGVETREEIDAIIALGRRVLSRNNIHLMMVFSYTPYPGTILYKKSMDFGFDPPSDLEGWSKIELHSYSTPWMKQKDIYFVEYLTTFIFRYMSGYTLRYIRQERNIIRKTGLLFLYAVANVRWKTGYFGFFLLDYWIYKTIIKISRALR